MADITAQSISTSGLTPTYSAVNSTDTLTGVSDGQRHFLHVKNGSGGSINVTLTAVKTSANVPGVGPVTISDIVVAVPDGSEEMIGPITAAYIDSSGEVAIAYSGTSSVTAAALVLPALYS